MTILLQLYLLQTSVAFSAMQIDVLGLINGVNVLIADFRIVYRKTINSFKFRSWIGFWLKEKNECKQ